MRNEDFLLSGAGDLVKDMGKAKILNAFLTSVFTEKTILLSSLLCYIFLNVVVNGGESSLCSFTVDRKLGRVLDTRGRPAEGPSEKEAHRSLMKFNKGKSKVLYLRMSNSMWQYMLGAKQLESNSAVDDLGVLVDKNIASGSRDMIVCLRSALVKHI